MDPTAMLDLRHALRRLRGSPGFTAVVLLTLGLGIGATTAIFSLVDGILLRPLDYPGPERIVTLWSWSAKYASRSSATALDFRDWHDQSRSFSHLARYRFGGTEGVVVNGAAENIETTAVSGDFFGVFQTSPRAGRLFSEEELRTGDAVVIGHGLVQRRFGGDEQRALGATLKVFGQSLRIVGIMPPGFAFPRRTEIWFPVDTIIRAALNRTSHNYSAIGRLAPGTSLAAAQAEMSVIAERLAHQYPESNRDRGVRLIALQDLLVQDHRATLWLLMTAAALVLAIGCANVANLMLARAARRQHELAVRAALGATPARMARQLLAESLVLAVAGGALGMLVAGWSLDSLVALAPRRIPGIERVSLDRSALLFAAASSLVVCLIIGVLPALRAARANVSTELQAGGRHLAGGAGRLRTALVTGQIAISFALLAGAGLVVQSLQRLGAVDLGYQPRNLLVLEANYPGLSEADGRRALAFFERVRDEAAALPGVTGASYTLTMPTEWAGSNGNYWIENRPDPHATALFRAVGPGYFSLIGIPVHAGRELDRRDAADAEPAVVITASVARASWPDRSPIGERVRMGWMGSTQRWMTIVGVVADTRASLDQPTQPEIYVAAVQHPKTALSLKVVARTTGEPLDLAGELRRRARALDPEVPVVLDTAERMVARALVAPRFRALLLALFAGGALLLAVVGVGGAMALAVTERRREIGVRLAVGATSAAILGHFLARTVRLASVGLGLGLVAVWLAGRPLQALLFGIGAHDPRTLALAAAALLVANLAAAAGPALVAARLSPLSVLRAE